MSGGAHGDLGGDELGLMVWEEPPGWQYIGDAAFQAIVLQNVRDMVIRDRNRPSVIVWATRLNESNNNTSLYAKTRSLAASLDDSPQTSAAMRFCSTSGVSFAPIGQSTMTRTKVIELKR